MSAETVLTFRELKERKKWPYSREHTARLVKQGRFPKPFKMGAGPSSHNMWRESDIDAYFAKRAESVRK